MKAQLKSKYLFVIFFLVVSSIVVYWQVKDHDFINLDDRIYITENPNIQNGLTLDSVKWAFTSFYASNWHPLTWISHMLDISYFGFNSGSHHLINIFFHIANILLLFMILHHLTHALWRSFFVAALFALHPLHVESVVWLAERKDVLSVFFWMLTMGAYILYAEKRSSISYYFALVFFALGLMTKPMLVTLPFVLLLLDYWPLDRFAHQKKEMNNKPKTAKSRFSAREEKPTKMPALKDKSQNNGSGKSEVLWANILPLLKEKIPFFTLSFVSCIVTIHAQRTVAIKTLDEFPFIDRLGNALVAYISYIGNTIWPINLAIFYPHPGMPSMWQVFISFILLSGITLLILWKARRFPYISMGWFWYLGTLVPVIGLVQVGLQSMADRYTYIPLIGLFIIAAWGVTEFVRKWSNNRIILTIISVLVLGAAILISFQQVTYWKNSTSLFEHALQVTKNNYLAYYNLGVERSKQGKIDEAIAHYQKCLSIYPNYRDAHYNLGVELAMQGKADEAIAHYRESLRIAPDHAMTFINLAVELGRKGKIDEAIANYREALKIEPSHILARFNLAIELTKQGKMDEAIANYKYILDANTVYASPYFNTQFIILGSHINLGIELAKQGKISEASTHFREVLRLDPENKMAKLYFRTINNISNDRINTK